MQQFGGKRRSRTTSVNALPVAKDEQVRQTVREQVYRRLGAQPSDCPPEVNAFINQAVLSLVSLGNLSAGDVQRVAQLAKPMMPDAGTKSPHPPPRSPKHGRPNTMPSPVPTATASLSSKAERGDAIPHPPTGDHRQTVEEKYNKLVREQQWAHHIDEEKQKYEAEQRALRDRRRETQSEQEASLRRQMEESAARKRNEVEERRKDFQKLLAQSKEREEEERKKEQAIKERSRQKRREMEMYMRERTLDRESMLKQQREEDREYLREIVLSEQEKKEIERRRKKLGREELLMFLSGNLENEKAKKKLAEEAIEQERREIALRDKVLAEKEAAAEAERLRKDAKSQHQMERAKKIQAEYDVKQAQDARRQQANEEREKKALEEKLQAERQQELERLHRQRELKANLVNGLEAQIADKKRRDREQAAVDASYRKQVEEALMLGDSSDMLLRKKMQDQKAAQMRYLEAQIREKHMRTQHEIPVKI